VSDFLIYCGDAVEVLRCLPSESVQTCVTSPPYYGLRDYGTAEWIGGQPDCDHFKLSGGTGAQKLGKSAEASAANVERSSVSFRSVCGKCGAQRVDRQIGLEETPQEYIRRLVDVFAEVWRLLRKDGTLWINLGDTYATGGGKVGACPGGGAQGARYRGAHGSDPKSRGIGPQTQPNRLPLPGLKRKDLIGIPWRVALALQEAGWYLRSDIIWHKPNAMPSSVRDRPTTSHEYIFLLAKSERYYYDKAAIMEPVQSSASDRRKMIEQRDRIDAKHFHIDAGTLPAANPRSRIGSKRAVGGTRNGSGQLVRNRRTVWSVGTGSYKGAHFAAFPPNLIRPCLVAGAPPGGVVLDPFCGTGTTIAEALRLGRSGIGVELNPAYVALAEKRVADVEHALRRAA
jgi:DNA modification methylase